MPQGGQKTPRPPGRGEWRQWWLGWGAGGQQEEVPGSLVRWAANPARSLNLWGWDWGNFGSKSHLPARAAIMGW